MKLLKQEDKRYHIDTSRKVFVYKNLHKDCWSVRQDGLVKMHAASVCLWDCAFRVNQKGREKVLKEKRKNVHAGIVGYLDEDWDGDTPPPYKLSDSIPLPPLKEAKYNPYKHTTFIQTDNNEPVLSSMRVKLKTESNKDKLLFEYMPDLNFPVEVSDAPCPPSHC